MKLLLFLPIVLLCVITPVNGQLLSDATGLVHVLDVPTDDGILTVRLTANFDIGDFEFDKDSGRLTIYILSSLENNLGEIVIPQDLLGGELSFYLDDVPYYPDARATQSISFVTFNFTGAQDHKLDIFGTIPSEIIVEDTITSEQDSTFYFLIILIVTIIVTAFVIKKKK